VRAILNEFYGTDGIHGYGYGQDEDQGQLGAWYVISSIGLFSVTGLNDLHPTFSLGSPLFGRISIRLSDKYYSGKRFVITTEGNADDVPYVQEYRLNGRKLSDPHISFEDVVKGGKLKIKFGASPVDKY
jgi:putative alpha-1,2-mannosidase